MSDEETNGSSVKEELKKLDRSAAAAFGREGRNPRSRTPEMDRRTVIVAQMILLISLVLVLKTVNTTVPKLFDASTDPALNPTPYGFTWSNAFWLIPGVPALFVMWRNPHFAPLRKPFVVSMLLAGVGILIVDLLVIAPLMFDFPNLNASWFQVPAYSIFTGEFRMVPVEDPLFYIFAMAMVFLMYCGFRVSWYTAYDQDLEDDQPGVCQCQHGEDFIVVFKMRYVGLGLVLIAGAFAVRYQLHGEFGWPGWAIYIICAACVPMAFLFDTVKHHVNYHALAAAGMYSFTLSVLYEVSLALPYGWWTPNYDMMLGLNIEGWFLVPVEELFLYLVNSWVLVYFFEFIVLWQARSRWREGHPDAPQWRFSLGW